MDASDERSRAPGASRASSCWRPPGRPPKLSPAQRRRLGAVLLKGARANGYRTELWITRRIAQVVERVFGVSYHRGHVVVPWDNGSIHKVQAVRDV